MERACEMDEGYPCSATLTFTQCTRGLYPFMFGALCDFEPIVKEITAAGLKEPYNWDEYASFFFPKAEELVADAEAAEREGNQEKASELYLYVSILSTAGPD